MSRRHTIPSNEILSIAVYTDESASSKDGAAADTAKTRPPVVTSSSPFDEVPQWKTTTSAQTNEWNAVLVRRSLPDDIFPISTRLPFEYSPG